jgi:polar amino acid transport system substrate-binding protein
VKQVVQNYRTGELSVEDVPAPICRSGGVLVRAVRSLVSAGTERMKVSQARMSLLQMAKARPDKVRQVMESVRQVGLSETIHKVRERLDALTPLGYSLAGVVEQVGGGIDEFAVGDRVACAGEGIACHAEFVFVPRNLCARIPESVSFDDAAFTTVGAIALNGVRQSGVALGDWVLVVGLGLVGQLGVQLLKAAGCRVIGVDLDADKVALAKACGADHAFVRSVEGIEEAIRGATGGVGPDVAYIAASAKSTDPMELAGKVLRDRGRVVIVGMVPVEADWQTYYEKELSVVMSRSYGPGRYDRNYEHKGIDYPIGHVRWTEGRNMQEFLRLVGDGLVRPGLLKPRTFPIIEAPAAYQELHDAPSRHAVGILFEYPQAAAVSRKVELPAAARTATPVQGVVNIGLIGAGNFATATLIPAIKKADGAHLAAVCSAGGLTARSAGGRHDCDYASSDVGELLADRNVHAVVIATRHDTHARFAIDALRAGKHVFVEKPLAMNDDELDQLIAEQRRAGRILMPGFNRRFASLSQAVKKFFAARTTPVEIVCRVSAGSLKGDSWYQDAEEGGWRILSEGCHFVDLMQFLVGAAPVRVSAEMTSGGPRGDHNDNCTVNIRFEDGSVGSLIYVANGDTSCGKERIEVFGQGSTAIIDNWREAVLASKGKQRRVKAEGGKGHAAEMSAFIRAAAAGGDSPIPLEEAVATTRCTFAIVASLRSGQPVIVGDRSATAEPAGEPELQTVGEAQGA